jgi:hypothetical protein
MKHYTLLNTLVQLFKNIGIAKTEYIQTSKYYPK